MSNISHFNLLDEPWIPVIVNSKGRTKLVSIKELFENAQDYYALAGDMKIQDFSLLRLLLAVLHTVFSRYDELGKPRDFDDDYDDEDEFNEKSCEIWHKLWKAKKFPPILFEYLEKWRDRFYLFDDKYPFFQATVDDVADDKLCSGAKKEKKPKEKKSNKEPSGIYYPKTINRLISQSSHKMSLFSPKSSVFDEKTIFNEKNKLTNAELARWIVTLQSYVGISNKKKFAKEKHYTMGEGWPFELGGLYLSGKTLFETLLLNYVCDTSVLVNSAQIEQKPCWEYSSEDIIKSELRDNEIDNIAQLYTCWSRALYVDSTTNQEKPITFKPVCLPIKDTKDAFLEPMTIWKYETGENKSKKDKGFYPERHTSKESMWRSFGLLAMPDSFSADTSTKNHIPGIMKWLSKIKRDTLTDETLHIGLRGVSIEIDDLSHKNLTNEVSDELWIDSFVVTDKKDDGWVIRINNEVNFTTELITKIYNPFFKSVYELKASSHESDNSKNIEREEKRIYFLIDKPFREWLVSLKPGDSKDERMKEWRTTVIRMLKIEADKLLSNSLFQGIQKLEYEKQQQNIFTVYNKFCVELNKNMPEN